MAIRHANELSALREQVLAFLPQLDTGGPVDQFQGSIGEMRSRAPDARLVNVVRALGAAIAAIDAYLQS